MATQATLVSVISADAVSLVATADELATNVHAVVASPDPPADLSALRDLWSVVKRKPPVYALAPFDPLGYLIEAWSARLNGEPHELELAIGLATNIELPDFYLVDEHFTAPRGAWYFELLYSEAPRRVQAFDGTAPGVIRALRELRAGPELPVAARIGEMARSFVPGTVGLVTQTARAGAQPVSSERPAGG